MPETIEGLRGRQHYECLGCGGQIRNGAKVYYVMGYSTKSQSYEDEDHVDGGYIHKKCHTHRLVTAKLQGDLI